MSSDCACHTRLGHFRVVCRTIHLSYAEDRLDRLLVEKDQEKKKVQTLVVI